MSLLKRLEQQNEQIVAAQKSEQTDNDPKFVAAPVDVHADLKERVRILTIEALNTEKEMGEKIVREKLAEVLQQEGAKIPRMERTAIVDELFNDIIFGVTQADYDVWVANYGNTAGSGSLSDAAVP